MKLKTDIEIKIRRFFRRFGKGILVGVVIVFIILALNKAFKEYNKNKAPKTTFTPDVPIMNSEEATPKKVQKSVEEFVKEYVEYCNKGEFEKSYEMISEECKTNYFYSYSDYEKYVKNKFQNEKKYVVQSYSNYNGKYIYSVKFFDDFLATGLTNSTYKYQEEKIVASYDKKKNLVISVGNFIDKEDVQSVQENDYLKADILSRTILYEFEEYKIRITNRSDNTVIIQNLDAETDEIVLVCGKSERVNLNTDNDVVLEPEQSYVFTATFAKRFDNGESSQAVKFNGVRVVDEKGKNIDKFSMTLGF